ncbi:hypothetical protein Tco_0860783 [Tanacetum coccineum]|uniref:Uncharacterized protein n=1 Tax=Tanacetum coccineum TaxID=301880 RepID=A0ABQ5BJC1_9ASTR
MHANKSFNKNPANHRLYHALKEALIEDENAMDKGVADTVKDHKRKHDDDDDDDEDPSETTKGKTPTKGSKTGKSAPAKEPVEEPITEVIMDDAGDDVARDDNLPQVVIDQPVQLWFNQMVFATKDPLTFNDLMATHIDFSNIKLQYNFQECFNALTDKLDWNNPEGDRYPFDLSKLLPLQGPPVHQTVAADYFFNNYLEYLKTSDPEVTYTTSITKIKAAWYEIKGIEDMVNKFSKQNVYSTKVILGVKSVSVKKLHGYGHLEEIMVKRSDQQLYKFKEGDFVDLHLNDIEDMILLAVQHKLFHLDGNNFPEIEFKEPYTPSYDPPGIVYEDLNKQKRVLRANELYKFSDGTLKSVCDEIHRRVLDFHLDYNTEMPKRKWTVVDQKRSSLMIELIDKQLREKEIIKNIERLVGARELEMDYKLMRRTV